MADNNLTKKLTVFPRITEISATADGNVHLEWAEVPLAQRYYIRRFTEPEGEYVQFDWVTDLSFTDTTAERDITYWYRIIAWKAIEGKKNYHLKSGALRPVTVSDIPAVKNLRTEVKGGKIHLFWDKGEGSKFYIYKRSDYFSKLMLIGETEKSTFCDEDTISGQAYHYTVQTVKIADGKELHGSFTGEADCAFVDTTEIRSVRKILGRKALINVRVIAGADGYIFERCDKKDGEFREVGRTEGITAVNFEDKLPSRFAGYGYRVCAYKNISGKEFRGGYSEVKYIK